MRERTNTYLLIVILTILIIMIIIFQLFYANKKQLQPSPSPTPTSLNPSSNFIGGSINQENNVYSFDKLSEDYTRIVKRKSLSESDLAVKNKLLSQLSPNNSIITDQGNFKVEYLKTPQYFMVEIKAGDADETKQETLDWFKNQGFSLEGICNLPVIFYVGSDIAEQYRENKLQFDPTIEGCN